MSNFSDQLPSEVLKHNPFLCYFDSPGACITKAVQHFFGWFAAHQETQPTFRVNGIVIDNVSCFERIDLKSVVEGNYAVGWSFYLDCAAFMTEGQHALVIEITVGDKIVGRNFVSL